MQGFKWRSLNSVLRWTGSHLISSDLMIFLNIFVCLSSQNWEHSWQWRWSLSWGIAFLPLSWGEKWRNVTKYSRGDGAVGRSSHTKRRGNKYQGPGWCPVPLPLPWEMGSRELKLRLAIDAHQGLSIFSEARGGSEGQEGQMKSNVWCMRELFVLAAMRTGICAACYAVLYCLLHTFFTEPDKFLGSLFPFAQFL